MQEQNSQQTPSTPNESNNMGRILLIALLLISLILNLYQWYDRGKEASDHEEVVDSLVVDMAEVDRQLSLTKAELEQYRGRSEQLDSLLDAANGKISDQESKIRALMLQGNKNAEINAELRRQLEELHSMKDKYMEEVDRLILENQRLQNENDSLSVELNNNVSQRNRLQARLQVAAQLRVDRVGVKSMKKRMIGGKMSETSLAKRTEKIEVCFVVLENTVATRGNKLISMRLVAPNGKALQGTSSGSFVNADTGGELTATANHQLSYDGSSMDLCMDWEDENAELDAGSYGVEIYIDGALVFTSSFTLE
ncbi:MAG: hypothetical protein GC180_02025 [Bacteroidetes bacterium]|nr:hypothetical protein [Bacteroidota bacterium]